MQLAKRIENELGCGFADTVRYCSPSHGGWGVVRMGMLVPESYQLFVCPFACGRHGAIGAIMQGYKNRLSYLCIDESDIVSGGYEQLICEAVEELFKQLIRRPKVLMIFVSCLDDLLGTDHESFLRVLRQRHSDVRFTVCHMNPITLDSKIPPQVNIQCKMYGLLEPAKSKQKNAAAFYGNNVGIDKNSEIYEILSAAGYTDILHISDYDTFSDYQKMAGVSVNIVPSPIGLAAASETKDRLGIDYVYVPLSYDFEEIEASYETILSRADLSINFETYKQKATDAISSARSQLGGLPLVIDSSATVRPFTLAKLLYSYGFNVEAVYSQQCIALECESYRWIRENAPTIKIVQPEHPRSPLMRRHDRECLAIGFEGAYLTGAKYVTNLVNDETLYGYHGIEKLMDMLVASSRRSVDLLALIEEYGLVV